MFRIDPNYNITIAQGDSMSIDLSFTSNDENLSIQFPKGAIAIFAASVLTEPRAASGVRAMNTVASPVYMPVLKKTFKIIEDNIVPLSLSNADTREIAVGEYRWDIRIVVAPEYNEQGVVVCKDPFDEIISIFSGRGELPKMIVTGVVTGV